MSAHTPQDSDLRGGVSDGAQGTRLQGVAVQALGNSALLHRQTGGGSVCVSNSASFAYAPGGSAEPM
jgi:hypothetical protein